MKTRIFTVALLLLATVACSKTPDQMLVGNWQAEKGINIEYFEDGGLAIRYPKEIAPGLDTLEGTWTVQGDETLTMTITAMGASETNTVTFRFPDGDTVEITDEKGVVDSMTRIAASGETAKPRAVSSGSVVGVYGGKGCVYEKMELKDNGKIYVTAFGTEFPGAYEVDGDRVLFTDAQGQGIVFKRKGDALDGGIAGVCTRI